MKKVIYNSGRAAYESPCCEILSLQAEGVVLTGSFGETGEAGTRVITDSYEEDF